MQRSNVPHSASSSESRPPPAADLSFLSSESPDRVREDRNRLRAIVDNTNAVIYVKDKRGRYLYVNRRYTELFHVRAEDIVGKSDFDRFPHEHAAAFRANDLKVIETGEQLEFEEIAPHDDGPHIYFSLKFPMLDAAGIIDGICGISTDITRFKKIEEDRNLFFHLTLDLMCIADYSGKFLFVNPSWVRTLGWTEEQLTARPFVEFVHPEDREATVSETLKLATGEYETLSFENRYLCADGSYKWLLWNAKPMPDRQLVFAAARDITRRKLSEKQQMDDARELAQAFDKSQKLTLELEKAVASERTAHDQLKKATSHLVQTEKLVALGQMVGGIAHEINNPLAYVSNNMAVLERDLGALRELVSLYQNAERQAPEELRDLFLPARAYAEQIDATYTLANLEGLLTRSRDGLKRIQQIVRDLKQIARGGARDWHQVDLNQGIDSVLNILRIQATRKKVHIETDLDQLPALQCHPAQIHQVVMNLVHNAIDACEERGRVILRTRSVGSNIEIHVLDNGQGISQDHLNKIFDPFFTTKEPGMGTGLGLSICHAIVEEHGGRIEVDSTVGRGTHFIVHLPIRAKDPKP